MKVGKTSFAASAPKNLMLCSERGLNAIAGVTAVDITKWTQLKNILVQLRSPQAKEMYDTITFDTITIFWELCEQYIASQAGVSSIADIEWGRGYIAARKEFASTLREITMMGYGIIFTAHSETRIEKSEKKGEVAYITPLLPKRPYEIVNQLVDIIGYIAIEYDDNGNSERYLYTRPTSTVLAGSRFPYLAAKIPFGYKELTEAVSDAIEKSGQAGAELTDEPQLPQMEAQMRPFAEAYKEARQLWDEIAVNDDGEVIPANAEMVFEIIEKVFNKRIRLSDVSPTQQDLFEVVIIEMKDLLDKMKRE